VVELDAGDGISVGVLVDGVLALATGVPNLDLVVKGTGEDLTVISRDGNGKDILGVADQLRDALALLDVPETDGVIPGGAEGEARVTGEAELRDEVRVSREELLGAASLGGLEVLVDKFPLDDGAIAGAREQELLLDTLDALLTDSEGGDPATVGAHVTLVDELFIRGGISFSHFGVLLKGVIK